ncbi:Enoyl-CoA hydratase [Candidatus Phaeomarinobacter ectocarpi]|uniref:Enoyl-CoA hydratase n=1 Tax=Candidatus Phaeomarinibacter ectocarpi TaxID=1458461 RepID=X5MAK9_9HYPH|nr:enoyl-CoA hydratase/isomerase [Candidatus Phaeomarinobacter ectocarpi]CDO60938.1 Enoyl-CoA hydratase [Candidatus Phaeomarinobacter ectocarpi]
MEFNKVKVDMDGDVAILTLNDPKALNAVSPDMLEGLADALEWIDTPDNGVRCVVMTGEGRGFCAGANLAGGRPGERPGEQRSNAQPDAGQALEQKYHPILRKIRKLKMPFVTAVNGPAAGVGMSFALMGDMVLAAKSSYFLQAFRRIGLVPDGGSTYLLPRLIGVARAKELSLLGEKLPADTALSWGLINRVYEDDALIGEAMKMAKDLASGPTRTLGLIREAYADSFDNTYEEQLDKERWLQREAGRTDDFKEGVKAFLEKRPAEFKGN